MSPLKKPCVPSIEDLMMVAEESIKEKKNQLSRLLSDGDFDPYAAAQLRREIEGEEDVLSKCRASVRDEKLGKLGL